MAPSTPPPPPDTSNTAATTTRPVFQNPPRPPNSHPFYSSAAASRLPSNPNPNYPQLAPRPPQPHPHPQDPSQLLYPVASSGRGFLSRPVAMPAARPSPRPPFVFPYLDQGQGNPGFVRANHFAHVFLGPGPGSAGNASSGGVMPGVVKGIPVPPSHPQKVGPPSASISDNNGHKDLRDKNKDDSFAIIRDRKVRISENASLYTLCRSWLRNGFPEETQDESSVENLSEKELLQRHIKRAKRVRSRLREERLQRITRYKTRLALLLPPMVEQHFKNESAVPN
ncbi:proline-rich receptor-like protein kinase PERK8 isoform X3 [Sesamum indicum]|uniref:Proline-rich receptor-like protein kinase PERK8 isoform X3 n=1 Tax=Sesamum indicum TaxID=4182 RepID=A0A6I9U363_SESIN|nr:proline-rich receptor-like protein kinase PERK8 isoform X3 [Sesamum indicum]